MSTCVKMRRTVSSTEAGVVTWPWPPEASVIQRHLSGFCLPGQFTVHSEHNFRKHPLSAHICYNVTRNDISPATQCTMHSAHNVRKNPLSAQILHAMHLACEHDSKRTFKRCAQKFFFVNICHQLNTAPLKKK